MNETKIGKYTILGEIGRGAMGIVYKATDPYIGRTVAIKTIRFDTLGQGAEREMAQKRFMREAHSAGNLSHPNIVTIYDVGGDGGLSYIAMEYIDGQSLEDVVSGKKKMSLDEIITLVEKVGGALDVAHRKGVVHRDIKPANILLDAEGQPHLVDFGIARISTSTMTQTNMIMGTPYYMSPEQIAGKKVDNRSDIFALGGVLYELLTGQKPFPGDSITTVIYKIMNEAPLPMRTFQKNLAEGLEIIVQKALAKDPGARYQSCRAMVADLKNYAALGVAETLVREYPLEDEGQAAPDSGARPGRRKKLPLFIAGGVAAAAALLAIILIIAGRPPSPEGGENTAVSSGETAVSSARESFLSAQELMKEKKWDEALAALALIPESEPEYYEARFLSAETLFRAGRDAGAEEAFVGLTELRRDDSRVYLRLAQLYDKRQEANQALRFYQTYLSFMPKGPEAEEALKRLTALQKQGAAVVAKKTAEQPNLKPGSREGGAAVEPAPVSDASPPPVKSQTEPTSAEKKDASGSAKTEPKKPSSLTAAQRAEVKKLNAEGARAINRKDYDLAVSKLERALAVDPDNANARSHLVIARQRKAERDAQDSLKKAKEAIWYRRYDEALREARTVLALDPRNEDIKKVVGQALEGVRKAGPGQIEALAREYFQSVSKGDLTGFYKKNATPALYQKISRDMELVSAQFEKLRIAASGGKAELTDFQGDEARATVKKMAGRITFTQTMTGVPKGGGGRQTLFEGSIRWRFDFQGEAWRITDVVSIPKAKK